MINEKRLNLQVNSVNVSWQSGGIGPESGYHDSYSNCSKVPRPTLNDSEDSRRKRDDGPEMPVDFEKPAQNLHTLKNHRFTWKFTEKEMHGQKSQ